MYYDMSPYSSFLNKIFEEFILHNIEVIENLKYLKIMLNLPIVIWTIAFNDIR